LDLPSSLLPKQTIKKPNNKKIYNSKIRTWNPAKARLDLPSSLLPEKDPFSHDP